jgi:DNA-binding PadR family transcriptional regulator
MPSHVPLKPLVFEVLLALSSGERHGWDLVRDIQPRFGERLLPANFYRTLRAMLAEGLIEESAKRRPADDDERRRYFRLTTGGTEAVKMEARRLESLVAESRARRVLTGKPVK